MNSGHSFSEGMDYLESVNDIFKALDEPMTFETPKQYLLMDLEAKRQSLQKQKEEQERIKNDAHEKILLINRDLRKLAALTRHAEEMFNEKTSKFTDIDGNPLL